MARGLVKWFNIQKGYGFITPEGRGKDIFVHVSNVEGTNGIKEGDTVNYEVSQGPKGPSAINVLAC